MTEISNIRNLYFEEGNSITEINRITGKDRKTIKNYIEKEDWNKTETSEKIENTFPKLDPYISYTNLRGNAHTLVCNPIL